MAEKTTTSDSRVLLQKNAVFEVHEAVASLNEKLAAAARLGLRPEASVHTKSRNARKSSDGGMDDISVGTGDAATPMIVVEFPPSGPIASVVSMRG
jgi:hypothetical protein